MRLFADMQKTLALPAKIMARIYAKTDEKHQKIKKMGRSKKETVWLTIFIDVELILGPPAEPKNTKSRKKSRKMHAKKTRKKERAGADPALGVV